MKLADRARQIAPSCPDELGHLLLKMAAEVDRLGQEVLLLHNRTGDYSKGTPDRRPRPLAGDHGSYV